MIILGIDPGSHATGFGVIRCTPAPRMLAGGVVRPASGALLPQRLLAIHEAVCAVIAEHRPQVMAVEDLFNAKNARSSLVLGHARGVILLAGAAADLEIHEFAPRQVKQALTGNGAAAKQQVRFMVMRLLGLKQEVPMDQSDALAVALCCLGRLRSPAGR